MHNQEDKNVKKIHICFSLFVWMEELKKFCTCRGAVFIRNSKNALSSKLPSVALNLCISWAERAAAKCSSGFTPRDCQPASLQSNLQNPANISFAHEAPYGSPWLHVQLARVWRKHYLTPSCKWFEGYSRIKWPLLKKTKHYIWIRMYIHFCCSFSGWMIDCPSGCWTAVRGWHFFL